MADENEDAQDNQDLDTSDNDNQDNVDETEAQKIKSWVGRIEKEGKDTKETLKGISDTLSAISESLERQNTRTVNQSPELTKLNEDWQNRILSGDIVGVLDEYSGLKDNLSRTRTTETDKAVTTFAEKPFYKELHAKVVEKAHFYAGNGVDPAIAAKMAWHEANDEFKSGVIATVNQHTPSSLEFLKGGKGKKIEESKGRLPTEMKEAAKRDIEAGVFKDEADYIANLSPQLKVTYGLG